MSGPISVPVQLERSGRCVSSLISEWMNRQTLRATLARTSPDGRQATFSQFGVVPQKPRSSYDGSA